MTFYYSDRSAVFHKKGCRFLPFCKDVTACSDYATASEGPCPCKVCNPASRKLPSQENTVGWCRYKGHPGPMGLSYMKSHQCVEKECGYFQKNSASMYWIREDSKRSAQRMQNDKAPHSTRHEQLQDILGLRELWQSYLTDMSSDMQIIRVEQTDETWYKIFYVSDHPYADANYYKEFLSTLAYLHPHKRFRLQHIRDKDGRFVTREEYRKRKK